MKRNLLQKIPIPEETVLEETVLEETVSEKEHLRTPTIQTSSEVPDQKQLFPTTPAEKVCTRMNLTNASPPRTTWMTLANSFWLPSRATVWTPSRTVWTQF